MSSYNNFLNSSNSQHSDFEYHINHKSKNELDSKNPVIILFGWGGCSDKYLAKYSIIYEEQGCTTLRCIVSPRLLLPGKSNETKLKGVAEKIVCILEKENFKEYPLFFHSFSNGGCTVYNSVSQIIQNNEPCKFQIKGCIFDSAPAKINASNIMTAVVNAVKGNYLAKYGYGVLIVSYIYTVFGLNWISSAVHRQPLSSHRFKVFDSLAKEPNICPQLFLFSKSDDICPYESIQEFIEIRKENGVNVTFVLWENSEHVKHLITFREEYITAIVEFLSPYLNSVISSEEC